ncbi:MAG: alpha/beta hydrolase [Deltaproteobacteria bacterium]|nr:alpha/beta hydrolase [Deltaproteobacteria bacterium]
MKRPVAILSAACACLCACSLELDPPAKVIHARFDPDAKVIPMPTDVLRDEVAGHLDIPIDEKTTPAEKSLYTAMNLQDGWSTASSATVEFDGPINPATINADTVQVWHWRETPVRVDDVRISVSDDEKKLTIDPPRTGWERGEHYAIVVRGGTAGLEGKAGEKVDCDAAFYFLRQTERLDTPAHEHAFPGNTAAERQDNAKKLEDIRTDLAPIFDFAAGEGMPRDNVAALWTFTVTQRTELAMDKASQRVPLPLDVLKDPDTGHIDLPPAPWDSQTVLDAKTRLKELTGFGTSANLMFQFTGPVDPATITPATIEVWQVAGGTGTLPRKLEAGIELLGDQESVEVTPAAQPLDEGARFAIVVRQGVKAKDGTDVILMPMGILLQIGESIEVGGKSQVGPVPDDDARRLEKVRPDVVAALSALPGAKPVLAAWTFTTMPVTEPMAAWIAKPETLAVPMAPTIEKRQTPGQALGEFALAISSLTQVSEVVSGTIKSPEFLDPLTRGFRQDGGHTVEDIAFTAIVPRNLPAGKPVPVVIFGHAILTERRMLLALGDALARKGFAAVAIDLPLHGTRTICWTKGPLSIPDPTTGKLTPLGNPCSDNGTCTDDGRCVNAAGDDVPFATWPVIPMPMASGAAFLEIEKIANTRDHFVQAEIDLSALLRSLRGADWTEVFTRPVDLTKIYYAGQSLGGILGATFVGTHPEIARAVLNVPGADTVDMFRESPFFSGQVAAFFTREGVDKDSFDGRRFMNVARWFMDCADPASFARTLLHPPGVPARGVLIQMATLDAIIPNSSTKKLESLSGAPRRDYLAEHAFLVIPIEPEFLRGTSDLANYLSGELNP